MTSPPPINRRSLTSGVAYQDSSSQEVKESSDATPPRVSTHRTQGPIRSRARRSPHADTLPPQNLPPSIAGTRDSSSDSSLTFFPLVSKRTSAASSTLRRLEVTLIEPAPKPEPRRRLSRIDRLPVRILGASATPAQDVGSGSAQDRVGAVPVDPRVARPRPALKQMFQFRLPGETYVPDTSESTARKYARVMAKLNALPVHETTEEVDASVSTFLRDSFPTHVDGDVVLAFSAEMHETVGAMAQALPLLDHFKDWPNKLYLTEVDPRLGESDHEEATLSALKLLDNEAARPLDRTYKLDEDEFIDRAEYGQGNAKLRHLITDTGAKLTGYGMRSFDPLHGQPENKDQRELAQIQAIAEKAAANGATVIRGGAYHASEWMGVFTPMDGVKAVCVVQVSDPPPDDREAIDRLDELLSNPDVLPVLSADSLENRSIDLMPFVSFALSDVDRVHKLMENMESFKTSPPRTPSPPGEPSGAATD